MILDSHNPATIVEEAYQKFNKGDLSGAQMAYQSAIFEWVDEVTFGASDRSPETLAHIAAGVAELWIQFAHLNKKAKQFKAAAEVFETAVGCPVAGSMGVIWKEYAQFLLEREKNKKAQKTFLRPLVGDGSSDAGADKLDTMLDDVRMAKTGRTIQPGKIDDRVIPA